MKYITVKVKHNAEQIDIFFYFKYQYYILYWLLLDESKRIHIMKHI